MASYSLKSMKPAVPKKLICAAYYYTKYTLYIYTKNYNVNLLRKKRHPILYQ